MYTVFYYEGLGRKSCHHIQCYYHPLKQLQMKISDAIKTEVSKKFYSHLLYWTKIADPIEW
jgi:hypothetical protein